jgi:hypothetical protein
MADRFGYPVAEVAVNWSERPGSKVRLIRDSLRMLGDLWRLRGRLRRDPLPAAVHAPADRKAA